MILEKINNKTLEDVKKREEKISLDELETPYFRALLKLS